jgi:hypothetical protein
LTAPSGRGAAADIVALAGTQGTRALTEGLEDDEGELEIVKVAEYLPDDDTLVRVDVSFSAAGFSDELTIPSLTPFSLLSPTMEGCVGTSFAAPEFEPNLAPPAAARITAR